VNRPYRRQQSFDTVPQASILWQESEASGHKGGPKKTELFTSGGHLTTDVCGVLSDHPSVDKALFVYK
jgi:hypothetical protein